MTSMATKSLNNWVSANKLCIFYSFENSKYSGTDKFDAWCHENSAHSSKRCLNLWWNQRTQFSINAAVCFSSCPMIWYLRWMSKGVASPTQVFTTLVGEVRRRLKIIFSHLDMIHKHKSVSYDFAASSNGKLPTRLNHKATNDKRWKMVDSMRNCLNSRSLTSGDPISSRTHTKMSHTCAPIFDEFEFANFWWKSLQAV